MRKKVPVTLSQSVRPDYQGLESDMTEDSYFCIKVNKQSKQTKYWIGPEKKVFILVY
ncbi:MAG: hypothetical protein JWL86_7027 [Rhizobium sp.]|nr:hypothetical protein [Rhizobium sp.]